MEGFNQERRGLFDGLKVPFDVNAILLSAAAVLTVPTDVSKMEEVQRLKERVYADFGEVAVLMNNAGTSPGGGPWDHYERWQRVLSVKSMGRHQRRARLYPGDD